MKPFVHNTPRISSLFIHNVETIKISRDQKHACVTIELQSEENGMVTEIMCFSTNDGRIPVIELETEQEAVA
jgi:hypothetical protein